MKWVKLKFYLIKYSLIFKILLAVLGFLLIYCSWNDIVQALSGLDDMSSGTLGALLGAIVGGVLALMGSFWVSSIQLKGQANIKKKETIYIPLYNELMEIHEEILTNNPYPSYVEIGKGTQMYYRHPQYIVWGQIKIDNRLLETPKSLVEQMKKLFVAINDYIDVRHIADDEISEICNEALEANNLSSLKFAQIGYVLSSCILQDRNEDIYSKVHYKENNDFDKEIKKAINSYVYQKSNNLKSVALIRKKYHNYVSAQKETIEMLALLINKVNIKYKS